MIRQHIVVTIWTLTIYCYNNNDVNELFSVRVRHLRQVRSAAGGHQDSAERVRQLRHPWGDRHGRVRRRPPVPRDQDRARLRGQVHPDLARHGEGAHSEGDRHHEPLAPQQADQPPRRFRRWGRNGSHFWIVSWLFVFLKKIKSHKMNVFNCSYFVNSLFIIIHLVSVIEKLSWLLLHN